MTVTNKFYHKSHSEFLKTIFRMERQFWHNGNKHARSRVLFLAQYRKYRSWVFYPVPMAAWIKPLNSGSLLDCSPGATTLSIMIHSITTLSLMIHCIKALSIIIPSITTFSTITFWITTLSTIKFCIMTLWLKDLFVMLSKNDTQHKRY